MLDGAARLDILPSYGYIGERIECSLNNDREENAAEPKRPRVNGASDRGGNDFSSPRHILANFPWNRSMGYPLEKQANSLIFLIKICMIEKLIFLFFIFFNFIANFNNELYILHAYRFNNLCIILKYLIILLITFAYCIK